MSTRTRPLHGPEAQHRRRPGEAAPRRPRVRLSGGADLSRRIVRVDRKITGLKEDSGQRPPQNQQRTSPAALRQTEAEMADRLHEEHPVSAPRPEAAAHVDRVAIEKIETLEPFGI